MSNHPYKRIGTCRCGATFEAKNRWQRSCEKCIEERNAYEASKPIPVCRHCGEQNAECRYNICPTCRAKRDAERAARWERRRQREFKKFGACPHHPNEPATHDGVCYKCNLTNFENQLRLPEHREKFEAELQEQEKRKQELAELYARMNEKQKLLVKLYSLLMGYGIPDYIKAIDEGKHRPAEEMVEHPEQIQTDDQDRVDAAFYELMQGIDL